MPSPAVVCPVGFVKDEDGKCIPTKLPQRDIAEATTKLLEMRKVLAAYSQNIDADPNLTAAKRQQIKEAVYSYLGLMNSKKLKITFEDSLKPIEYAERLKELAGEIEKLTKIIGKYAPNEEQKKEILRARESR